MGTYQAKARGQEEPGDLHQGPRPVANHVFNVVIETVCPCPGGCRESVRTGVGQRVGLGKDLPAPSSPPHHVGETGSRHRSDTRDQQGAPSPPRASLASRLGMKTHVLTHGRV